MNKLMICLFAMMALWSVTQAEDGMEERQIEANRNLYNQELKDAKDSHAATVTLVKESEKL